MLKSRRKSEVPSLITLPHQCVAEITGDRGCHLLSDLTSVTYILDSDYCFKKTHRTLACLSGRSNVGQIVLTVIEVDTVRTSFATVVA